MGRELRRVPKNWEHPRNERGYRPMIDVYYLDALNEWWESHLLWLKGEHDFQHITNPPIAKFYAEFEGDPPSIDDYRLYSDKQKAWYQLYETVSAGTPLSPPFETSEELVQYLVANGDSTGSRWTLEQAQRFIETEIEVERK